MVMTVKNLKRDVIPGLFADPTLISTYGADSRPPTDTDDLATSPTELAAKLNEIVATLTAADPRRIARPVSGLTHEIFR